MAGITAIGDLGYVGVEGIDIVPIKRAPKCDLRPCDKQFNTSIAKIRALNEQAVAHFKNWRMMSEEGGRCRIPIHKFGGNPSNDNRAHFLQVFCISLSA
jgi:hypothetical protein